MFTITASSLCWLEGCEESDLCLHGHASAVIGEEHFEYTCTVSATALYLLKTLTEDHRIGEDNQMLPCCGHFFAPDETLSNVMIVGCDKGIDWTVLHDGDEVRLITESGRETRVPLEAYKAEVCRFADLIEAFYLSSIPRKLSAHDDYTRDGYTAFWNEWQRRRKNAAIPAVEG